MNTPLKLGTLLSHGMLASVPSGALWAQRLQLDTLRNLEIILFGIRQS